MMMCQVCKKNVAVIFVNKIVNGKQQPLALCMECAKKQGISPINQMIEQSGMTQKDIDNINNQMMKMFENNYIDDLDDNENIDIDNKENPLMKFINNTFAGITTNKDENLENDNKIVNEEKNTKAKVKSKKPKKKRKYLNNFGINLTEKAKSNQIDRIIGREKEIDRVIQILNRRTKNNPVLIGEPGVGKTAIAEGLAVRIIEKKVPLKLFNTEIYLLDLTSVVAGTQFRGQFEGRMKAIIKEAQNAGNIILVIDELHNIMGAGEAQGGAMNAANILKPALARGDIQIIGATTLDEYRKHIEKDSALERRFQPVLVEESSIQDSIEILKGIKDYYEDYHKVSISDDIIKKAVILSERYIFDRFLPDKAIDVIDEASSRVNLRNKGLIELEGLKNELADLQNTKEQAASNDDYETAAKCKMEECKLQNQLTLYQDKYNSIELTVDDIAQVIEAWTKIPVQKITEVEAKKLLDLENRLHKRVIGQDKAISSLAKTIRRNRSGFRKKRKPSSFIFVGPTGVGKTELVKTLAKELFESEDAMIRLDMSEYMEKHTVSKLIGAPPGYVGYDAGGQLTEKVRRKPYSVILLDEIEKAHPDVFNMLLQILEDGRLTDNQGRTVNFENTVIIMTSNAGTNFKSNSIGFAKDGYDALESKIKDALREIFKPEFLNRVDETIIFTELSKSELRQIIDLMLLEVSDELKDKGMSMTICESAKDFILDKGYDRIYGARPLRKVIQKYIEDEITDNYLKGLYTKGCHINIDCKNNKIVFN